MTTERRLDISLLALRLTIFLVMLIWTLDKFVNPDHATAVYEHFYFISGVSDTAIAVIGGLELVLLAAFVAGYARRMTYGAVLALHAVSTLSSMPKYLEPFDNLLFFAAWPMLGACLALYLLRDSDHLWSLGKGPAPGQ